MISVGIGGVVWAEQTVPSGLAALLVAAVPFWMVGIERVMRDAEPLGWRRLRASWWGSEASCCSSGRG